MLDYIVLLVLGQAVDEALMQENIQHTTHIQEANLLYFLHLQIHTYTQPLGHINTAA
jgi:uncharacterized membrane protein YcaP (DUF421 family)